MRKIAPSISVLLGIFFIVFGGYDDSPGAQLIGLLLVILGVVRLFMSRKTKPTVPHE